MITYFDYATLPVTPWKNGAGATREIIAVPSVDAPFLWRASIATLQADGPFSPFPGVDRTIVLLAGRPLRLRGWRVSRRLGLMLALELAGVDIVLLHFAPQGGAANIQQLRHLLHPPAGHPGSVNDGLFFDGAKGQAGRQQR